MLLCQLRQPWAYSKGFQMHIFDIWLSESINDVVRYLENAVSIAERGATSLTSFLLPKIRDVEKGAHLFTVCRWSCSLHDLEHMVGVVISLRVWRLCDVVRDVSGLGRHQVLLSSQFLRLAEFSHFFICFRSLSTHFD